MPLNLAELIAIARGDIVYKKGVAHVTTSGGVTIQSAVTPLVPSVTPATTATPQNTNTEILADKVAIEGVTSGVTLSEYHWLYKIEEIETDPDFWQRIANRRNAAAAKAGQNYRYCGCQKLATLAVGRARQSRSNPEGVTRWLCEECFQRQFSCITVEGNNT